MLDKRLNDKGKNWRHVLKALKVTDYCLHEGSELVVTWAKQNIFIIKTLREFIYVDEEGKDVGQNGTQDFDGEVDSRMLISIHSTRRRQGIDCAGPGRRKATSRA